MIRAGSTVGLAIKVKGNNVPSALKILAKRLERDASLVELKRRLAFPNAADRAEAKARYATKRKARNERRERQRDQRREQRRRAASARNN